MTTAPQSPQAVNDAYTIGTSSVGHRFLIYALKVLFRKNKRNFFFISSFFSGSAVTVSLFQFQTLSLSLYPIDPLSLSQYKSTLPLSVHNRYINTLSLTISLTLTRTIAGPTLTSDEGNISNDSRIDKVVVVDVAVVDLVPNEER